MREGQLKLTHEAREDLKDIWRYIAESSINAADSFIDELYQECLRIHQTAFWGRNRPELGESITSYPFRKYILYFHSKGSTLYVLRVLHGSRDQSKIFSR